MILVFFSSIHLETSKLWNLQPLIFLHIDVSDLCLADLLDVTVL